jgi:hypothetical protein
VTPRRGFTHHGIYVGGGRVVHYAGLCRRLHVGPVEEVDLVAFAADHAVSVRIDAHARYAPAEVVRRARSRLGEDRYRIASNNCEHFCTWCLRGEGRSEQVERLLAWPRAVVVAVVASLARLVLQRTPSFPPPG